MGADGQVVGTALTATIGSLALLTAGFVIWRRCGPGRPYFKKPGDTDDDYYLPTTQQSVGDSNDKGKKNVGDEEAEVGMGGKKEEV